MAAWAAGGREGEIVAFLVKVVVVVRRGRAVGWPVGGGTRVLIPQTNRENNKK